MMQFSKFEHDYAAANAAYESANARQHQQRRIAIPNIEEKIRAAHVENELRLDAKAQATAEGREYDGPSLIDIAALETELMEANRVLEKMAALTKAKSIATREAYERLLMAQRHICSEEVKQRGIVQSGFIPWQSIADMTVKDLIEIEQLAAWADQRPPSLRSITWRIVQPDWSKVDARECAFAKAREVSGGN